MNKKEAFFVWRGPFTGELKAAVTLDAGESQFRMRAAIKMADPFQWNARTVRVAS